jgi:predicted phosphoribosyltransferase
MFASSTPRFADRTDAGKKLARALGAYAGKPDLLVLGVPRGGVPVAFAVARTLRAPLDVFVVRKLGVPSQEELAMGAVAPGGVTVLNHDIIEAMHVEPEAIDEAARRERAEIGRRERAYRGDTPALVARGKIAILVDDGLATGSSMRAGVLALRQQDPARVVVAVPVASPDTCDELRALADDVVCARTPQPFHAVGFWYEDFPQTTDDEVRAILALAAVDRRAAEEGARALRGTNG